MTEQEALDALHAPATNALYAARDSGAVMDKAADRVAEAVVRTLRDYPDMARALGIGVCPTPCDPDCGFACHEAHEVKHKRSHEIADLPGGATVSADVRYIKAGGSYLVYSEMDTFPWRPSLIGSVRRDPESGEWYAWAHMPGEPKSWRNHRGTARTRREATDLILGAS